MVDKNAGQNRQQKQIIKRDENLGKLNAITENSVCKIYVTFLI